MNGLTFVSPGLYKILAWLRLVPTPEEQRECERAEALVDEELDRHRAPELLAQLKTMREEWERISVDGWPEFDGEVDSDDEYVTAEFLCDFSTRLGNGYLFIKDFIRNFDESFKWVAYWVEAEQVYVANDAARALSPDLPNASTRVSMKAIDRRVNRYVRLAEKIERKNAVSCSHST